LGTLQYTDRDVIAQPEPGAEPIFISRWEAVRFAAGAVKTVAVAEDRAGALALAAEHSGAVAVYRSARLWLRAKPRDFDF